MKTILVPTDFSNNANDALDYAISLFQKENAKIILLNVFDIAIISPGLVPPEYVIEQTAITEQKIKSQLESLCQKITASQLKCEQICKRGLTVNMILETIGEKNPDLVIMGTKGASGIKEMIIGSNTATVITKVKCPVIAVPECVLFRGIKKITYATDYNNSDISALNQLLEIVRTFNTEINLLHVSDGEYTPEAEKILLKQFTKKVNNKVEYDKYNTISYQLIQGKNIEQELEKYLTKNTIDLLVMSTQYRSLIDKLFSRSITKKMTYHTKVPLMVFHYREEQIDF